MADGEPDLTEEEHEEYVQETLPYGWIAEAIAYASEEIAIDLRGLLRQSLDGPSSFDRLVRIRMANLLSALEDQVGGSD